MTDRERQFSREVVDQAHITFCAGCDRCRWALRDQQRGPWTCCGAVIRCGNCFRSGEVKFQDGHNEGVVSTDPWGGRVVLEWADEGVLQTRVSFSADTAEAYANAILAAVQEVSK